MQNKKRMIGWREWVSLPDLGIPAIKAKVDSGARTSALHTFDMKRSKQNQKDLVEFWLHPLKKNADLAIKCKAEIIDVRKVKDSGGHVEERFFIQSTVICKDLSYEIEISLTNRENMLFRMLLGRSALSKAGLVIEPSKSYLFGTELSEYYEIDKLNKEES